MVEKANGALVGISVGPCIIATRVAPSPVRARPHRYYHPVEKPLDIHGMILGLDAEARDFRVFAVNKESRKNKVQDPHCGKMA